MISKIWYLFEHYAIFIAFIWAFWGIGQTVLVRILKLGINDQILFAALTVALGQGIFIVMLQFLAVTGILLNTWIVALLVGSGILGITELKRNELHILPWLTQPLQHMTKAERCGLVLMTIYVLPMLLAPLATPFPGDELLYHLPHAQQWAQSGYLSVNDWLRYPWFPYNYELLFAGAFIIYGDVFTHMFNMLAGLLVALITYRLGVRHFSKASGFIAAIIWIQINRGEFCKSLVDMGLTLYIFTAAITFYWWLQKPKDRRWLAISAFLIGVAVGSKYQGLIFLTFFGMILIWVDRKPTTWLLTAVCILVPCIYWYGRNAIMTGDPFNPFGGKLFGFYDWNLTDYANQFKDLKLHSGWPHWLLWPAIFSLWWPNIRKSPVHIAATVFCGFIFLIWLETSHYPRYLMPIFPLLALLAAEKWIYLVEFFGSKVAVQKLQIKFSTIRKLSWVFIFVVASGSSVAISEKYWSRISTNQETRNVLLRKKIPGYPVLEYVTQHPVGRIYLIGNLADSIYYAPHPIWGDFFGPWRYSDIVSNNPVQLYKNLLIRNFDAVIVDGLLCSELESHMNFQQYFFMEFQSGGAKLYRLKKNT